MTECEFCGEEFDSERELHLHWGKQHKEKLNSHQEEKVKKAERKEEEEKENQKSRRRNLLLKGLTGVTLIIFVALILPQIMSMFQSGSFKLDQQPMIGDENASVTIVEFGDYRCPYCQRFEQKVFPQLKENYIDTGKANFHFINYPFLGKGSNLGARAGECVYRKEPESFWNFHKTMYQNQGPESIRWLTEEVAVDITNKTTNISAQEIKQCLDSKAADDAVSTDKKVANKNGIQGTPTIYVNGQKVGSDYQSIKNAIEKHLPDGQ